MSNKVANCRQVVSPSLESRFGAKSLLSCELESILGLPQYLKILVKMTRHGGI
jgi:hypothetical protein